MFPPLRFLFLRFHGRPNRSHGVGPRWSRRTATRPVAGPGSRRSIGHRIAWGGASAGLAAGLTIGLAVDAGAAPPDRKVSPAAKRAGITAEGGGYAGWAMRARMEQGPAAPEPRRADGDITTTSGTTRVPGLDVASYQGNVDWQHWWSQGKRFAYVKATEGLWYRNPYFSQQYTGSFRVGMIRGAYHFARPDGAKGSSQARYFVRHGGGWSADGQTLPGVVDLEDNYINPSKRCWGNQRWENRRWLRSFVREYHRRAGRYPVIYTNPSFWRQCVRSTRFSGRSPLWIAYWSGSDNPPESLPGGWSRWTFWQFYGTGKMDLNRFNGGMRPLRRLALGYAP